MMSATRKCEYSRDSFDRFGDDLCEKMLSYLSLDQCFRCECVSSQWRRFAFNGQTRLKITAFSKLAYNNETVNKWLFAGLIKKCRFVTDIAISGIDDELADTIVDHCHHLRAIHFTGHRDISCRAWQRLIERCGESLLSVSFGYFVKVKREHIQALFRRTPNLIECKGVHLINFIADSGRGEEAFLPKLRKITARFTGDSDFRQFADQYCDRLENINLTLFDRYDNSQIVCMFEQLSRFERLERLSVELRAICEGLVVNAGLNRIALNCGQLRELRLGFTKCFARSLAVISHRFDSLRRLSLNAYNSSFEETYACLSFCPNLLHLDVTAKNLKDELFANIHAYVPKLKTFRLQCKRGLSDKTMLCLAELKDLTSLKIDLYYGSYSITDNGLSALIANCSHIRRIELLRIKTITKPTIDMFVTRAKSDPKHNYALRTNVELFELSISEDELNAIANALPLNVEFDVIFDDLSLNH